MKIFVISLKNSSSRRLSISKQLNRFNLPFQFFDAIDGRVESHSIFKSYNNKKRIFLKGYPLKPGELGCFASHYSLWKKCIALDESILVLEDDIKLEADFLTAFEKFPMLSRHFHYFRIGRVLDPKLINILKLNEKYNFVLYKKPVRSTQGYVISPTAAKKLISAASNWHEPVDDFMEKEWLHGVINFGIEPPIIKHDFTVDSEIGERAKPYIPLKVRIFRESHRSSEDVISFVYGTRKIISALKIKKELQREENI